MASTKPFGRAPPEKPELEPERRPTKRGLSIHVRAGLVICAIFNNRSVYLVERKVPNLQHFYEKNFTFPCLK